MKLYATTTSNRATKGQGGDWLNIEIQNEAKETVYLLNVQTNGKDTELDVIETTKRGSGSLSHKETSFTTKGKQQKGEKICSNCKSSNWGRDGENSFYCKNCSHPMF